jgi:hypothetical protein
VIETDVVAELMSHGPFDVVMTRAAFRDSFGLGWVPIQVVVE